MDVDTLKWLYCAHACSDFVKSFLLNLNKRTLNIFYFEDHLVTALLNSLNRHICTKMAIVCMHTHQFGSICWWIFWCVITFCFLKVISPEHSLFDFGMWDNLWWMRSKDGQNAILKYDYKVDISLRTLILLPQCWPPFLVWQMPEKKKKQINPSFM